MADERILIVEHDREMVELFTALLESEGYKVDFLIAEGDAISSVRERPPDLLVLDILPGRGEEAFSLLDVLRTDASTASIPVVVMTTQDGLADNALASYNVKASLAKPFDIQELQDAIRHALDTPPIIPTAAPSTAAGGAFAEAERILAAHSREALFRWAQRLQMDPRWKGRGEFDFRSVLNSVPLLVEAVTAALRHGSPEQLFETYPETAQRVLEHARLRREQGIPLATLVREYSLLRNELLRLFRRHLPRQMAMEDVLVMEEAVNSSLDSIVELTIPAYLEGWEAPAPPSHNVH